MTLPTAGDDDGREVFRPRQKMQSGSGAEKGSAFALEAADAKARADKTARLRAARLAKEASEPAAEQPAKKARPARKS